MNSFIEQARLYAHSHEQFSKNYMHFLGIPLIIFSLMIFLGFIKIIMPTVFITNLAFLTTVAVLIYYFRLKWQLAAIITPFFMILLAVASLFNGHGPTPLGITMFLLTFIAGWALQAYHHVVEGEKNAIFLDLQFALFAPLYLTAELLFLMGLMCSLKDEIHQQHEKSDLESQRP